MAQRNLTPEDVDRITEMDAAKRSYFYRDPDRPDTMYVRSRGRVSPEVKKAQGRLRTARWRSELDRKRAPTVHDVGMSLAVALATTSDFGRMTKADLDLIRRALLDLEARGFDMCEARKTMRRLRIKMVDLADRAGEPTESTGPAITPTAWGDEVLPF